MRLLNNKYKHRYKIKIVAELENDGIDTFYIRALSEDVQRRSNHRYYRKAAHITKYMLLRL